MMRAPIFLPRRGDIAGILLFIGIALAVVIVSVFGPHRLSPPNNFGPDWTCEAVGQGEPICMKKIRRKGADQAP